MSPLPQGRTASGIETTGQPEPGILWVSDWHSLRARAVDAVKRHDLRSAHVVPDQTELFPHPIGESTAYAKAGIPVVQLMSGPEYLFTSDDTLDKVAVDQLSPAVGTFVDLLRYADKTT